MHHKHCRLEWLFRHSLPELHSSLCWRMQRKNDQGNRLHHETWDKRNHFVKPFTVSTSSTWVQVSGSAKNLGCFPRDAWARGSTGGCRTWVVRRDHVQQDHYKEEVALAAWWTCTVTTVNCRCFWMKFVIFQRYRSGVWWVKIYHENRSVNAVVWPQMDVFRNYKDETKRSEAALLCANRWADWAEWDQLCKCKC